MAFDPPKMNLPKRPGRPVNNNWPGRKPSNYVSGNYKKSGDKYVAWKTATGDTPDFGKGERGPGTPYLEVNKTVNFPWKNASKKASSKGKSASSNSTPATNLPKQGKVDFKTDAIRRRLMNG